MSHSHQLPQPSFGGDRLSIMVDPAVEEKQQLRFDTPDADAKRQSRLSRIVQEQKRQNRASIVSFMNPHPDPLLHQHAAVLRDLPSLELVLSRKTCPPVCLYNFYVYLRDVEYSEENLDFWLDVVAHESLCRSYCQTLIKSKAINAPLNNIKRTTMRWSIKDVTQELRYSTYSNSVGSEVRTAAPPAPGSPTEPAPVTPLDHGSFDEPTADHGAYCDHPYCKPGRDPHHPQNTTRQDLKKSAERIYYRYIVAGAEHELNMPELMRLRICRMIEMNHRDDPDVFLEAKNYVFNLMAHDAFPRFLYARAYENMGYTQTMLRLVMGLVSLILGFTIELCLIFLAREPKALRWFGLIPIWFGFLNMFVNQEKLCPLFTLLGISEHGFCRFNRVRDHQVRRIHIRRALVVAFSSLVLAIVVTLIFYLVPSHRL
ncbi:Bud site selection protein, Revert to axial protein 1 [Tieghemiomyces parasiticus]|uniref:Bud site selection protein, Revert to axial protein 1 n=1 Tax=Tieghemiomyces parasiticus TaxID=78921 RepID=A0A9W8E0J8_9FUNG|nr:Bud site selection protein, Revert to axial protein 1 [Tieghemiomyces parasiticus]